MVDNPHGYSHRPCSIGSEVVKVRDKIRPIDGYKLRELLSYKGTQVQVAEELGFCQSTISKAITSEQISYALAGRLEERYGIKFEKYARERKEEPTIEESIPESTDTSNDKALLNTIITQLGVLNNNILAMNFLLEKNDKDIKIWEE